MMVDVARPMAQRPGSGAVCRVDHVGADHRSLLAILYYMY